MSFITGKSDFCDWCTMHNTLGEVYENAVISIRNVPLKMEVKEDLIPWYPYIMSCMDNNNETKKQYISLSDESWIDMEEKDFLATKIQNVMEAYKKCKGEEFNYEQYCQWRNAFYCKCSERASVKAIIDIIKHHEKEFSKLPFNSRNLIKEWIIPRYFSTIHDSMHNEMRERHVEYCGKNGFMMWDKNMAPNNKDGKYSMEIYNTCLKINEWYDMKNNDEEREENK